MNIIVAGCGKVGMHLVRQLSKENHELRIVDNKKDVIEKCIQQCDVMAVCGNSATLDTLTDANIEKADLVIAVTGKDEINLLTCFMARKLNPKIKTIARVSSPEYAKQMYKLKDDFGLSMYVNPEQSAANEIFRLLQYPGFLKRETFARGLVEIVELRVERGSKLDNVEISKLHNVINCKVLICAIARDGETIIPSGSDRIQADDHIYVTASTVVLSNMIKQLGLHAKKVKKVTAVGGGALCYYLAVKLLKSNMNIKIIEKDYDRCIKLSMLLPGADIIHGDGTSHTVLESEGLKRTDALLTLTGIDEQNIIVSMYGASVGIPQVVTKVNRIETSGFLEKIDMGGIINPEEICSSTILKFVRAMQNQTGAAVTLHHIAGGQAEALEFYVSDDTKYINVPLREIKTKENVIIACIINNKGKLVIPDGSSTFSVGDQVIIVTANEAPFLCLNDIFE